MKIDRISYGRTFPLGNYASERIDLEAEVSIDEYHPTTTCEHECQMVVDKLKEMVESIHRTNNPHLYQEKLSINADVWKQHTNEPLPPNIPITHSEPEEKITPETGRKHTILEIQKCTTEKELSNWKLIAYLHTETKEAFDNRLMEISGN